MQEHERAEHFAAQRLAHEDVLTVFAEAKAWERSVCIDDVGPATREALQEFYAQLERLRDLRDHGHGIDSDEVGACMAVLSVKLFAAQLAHEREATPCPDAGRARRRATFHRMYVVPVRQAVMFARRNQRAAATRGRARPPRRSRTRARRAAARRAAGSRSGTDPGGGDPEPAARRSPRRGWHDTRGGER